MNVKWKGRDLGEFRGMPRLKEARMIKARTGWRPKEWLDQLQEADPDATVALVVLMLGRNGEQVRFEDVDGEYDDFEIELTDEEKAKQAEQQAEVVNPVIKGILAELGVDAGDERVREVVMRHLQAAQNEQEGKDAGAAATSSTGEDPATPS